MEDRDERRGDDLVDEARRDLVEPEVLPLAVGIWRSGTTAGCLAVSGVLAGMVVVPVATTALIFFVPAVAANWIRFSGLVMAMVVSTILLVYGARRLQRVIAERGAARRLRRYNEAESERVRALVDDIAAPDEAGREAGTIPALLREPGARLIRLSYLAEYCHPLRRRKIAEGPGRRLLETHLGGLAIWLETAGELRRLASFVAQVPPELELDDLDMEDRLAETPASDLVRAAEAWGATVDDRGATFRLP